MTPEHYRITVRGRLSERFASAFDGLTPEPGDGETSLVGPIADQAELFGVFERLRAFGLELIRVESIPE
jgi:hypothetical protein